MSGLTDDLIDRLLSPVLHAAVGGISALWTGLGIALTDTMPIATRVAFIFSVIFLGIGLYRIWPRDPDRGWSK